MAARKELGYPLGYLIRSDVEYECRASSAPGPRRGHSGRRAGALTVQAPTVLFE